MELTELLYTVCVTIILTAHEENATIEIGLIVDNCSQSGTHKLRQSKTTLKSITVDLHTRI